MSNSTDVNERSGSPRNSRNPDNTLYMTVGSQVEVGPIKLVSSTPAGGNTDPLKGNDTPVRGETEQAGA